MFAWHLGTVNAVWVAIPESRPLLSSKALMLLFFASFWVAYTSFFLNVFGATPGKLVGGLRVVGVDGRQLSGNTALKRSLAELVSLACAGIGFWMARADREGRALHDWMCGTRVVAVRASAKANRGEAVANSEDGAGS